MKMRKSISFLIVLFFVSTLNLTTSDAQDSTVYMYWADHGNDTNKIRRANLDGTNVQDIATGFGRPVGIALDLPGDKIYWTDRNNRDYADPNARNSIHRMNLDGTNIETLVTGGPSVKEAIALDTAGGKMYWVDWNTFTGAGKIQRANLNGTNVEDVVSELVDPRGIALDLSRGKMYWTDGGTGKIQRANFDGSNIEDLVTELAFPVYMALDFSSGKIYWATGVGKIQRANFDGSNVEDLVTGLSHGIGIALDSLNGKMYWTHWFANFQGSKIQRANLDGSNVEDLVTGVGLSVGIALGIPQTSGLRFSPNVIADQTFTVGTSASLPLPEATGGTPPYTYSISALPAGLYFDAATRQIYGTPTTVVSAHPVTYTVTDANGSTVSLDFTITVQDTPLGANLYMYWVTNFPSKIQRANLDGSNIQDLITTGLFRLEQIALDIIGGKMYWTDSDAGKIQRANLDGSNIQDLVTGLEGPWGVALDIIGGKMYWTDYNTDKIQRANLDGSNVQDLITTGLNHPVAIALDVNGGKMYWTDYNTGKIQRANLDGSNVQDLITTGLNHPVAIALDVNGGKMYWTNTFAEKIQCANLDGSNVRDLVDTGTGVPHAIALDITGGKMYWTDHNTDKIQRANLDGSNVEELIRVVNPVGIALSIPQVPPGDGLRFSPNMIADQTFTVGTSVSLTLPIATGSTAPYTYTLAPTLPAGLYFDPIANGPGYIGGTPTTAMPPTTFTYTAIDATGASAFLTFTITVEDGGLNLDVNRDGQVNVIDLAIVALFYGTRVPVGVSLPADVNADGVVDLLDLTAVAQGIDAAGGGLNQLSLWEVEAALLAAVEQVAEIGAVAGAPMGFGAGQHALSNGIAYGNVAAALSDAKQMTVGDVRLGKGMAVLEGLLQLLAEMGAIPETTALLPNYPNPFNPETWIPYQLANAADVTLTVYDMRGVAVRQLVLGHQAAGVYQSRGRAAYWDGKNDFGEPVASGVYFYTLTAGDFTATRKLLIAK